jgi:hypothetical protein
MLLFSQAIQRSVQVRPGILSTRPLLLVGVILVLSAGFSAAQDASMIKVELYPEGQHTNPAVLQMNGQRYANNPLIPVPLESPNLSDDLKFLSHVISTNGNGTLEEVLKLWDSRERESIRKVASDPTLFEGNQKFYRNITASHLLAKVHYGTYQIFFVSHALGTNTIVKEYPVVQEKDSLVLTNALQSDPVFAYLSTKYSQTLRQQLTGK